MASIDNKAQIFLYISDYTLKYAFISKNKKRFIEHTLELNSKQCKTALHRLASLSRKLPTTLIFPSYYGKSELLTFDSKKHLTPSQFNLFFKLKFEKKGMPAEVLHWQASKKQRSTFALPKSKKLQLLNFFESSSVHISRVEPFFYSPVTLFQKAEIHCKNAIYCFCDKEVIEFYLFNKQRLKKVLGFDAHTTSFTESFFKTIIHFKDEFTDRLTCYYIGCIPENELLSLSRIANFTHASPSLSNQLFGPLFKTETMKRKRQNSLRKLKSLGGSISGSKKRNRKAYLISALCLFSLIFSSASWLLAISSLKYKRSKALSMIETSKARLLSKELSLSHSNPKVQKLQKLSIYEKERFLRQIEGKINNTDFLLWVGKLHQQLSKKHTTPFFIEEYKYEVDKRNRISIILKLRLHNKASLKTLNELIKQPPVAPQKLTASFQNNVYEASFLF